MSSVAQQWELVVAFATELGVGSEAIRKWRERGSVSHRWRLPIVEKARGARKSIDPSIFDNVPQSASPAQ